MNERVGVGAVGNPLFRVFQATVGGLPSTGAAASTPGTNSGTTRPNFHHLTGHDLFKPGHFLRAQRQHRAADVSSKGIESRL